MKPVVEFRDLGEIDYKSCWDFQEVYFKQSVDAKMHNRKFPDQLKPLNNYLIFCEHPHVYTLGKSGKEDHLLINQSERDAQGIDYYKINRGGDITYHGPGQIVAYPILDLEQFFTDIHKYLRFLEEAVILTLKEYGIDSGRVSDFTGVWIDGEDPTKARKICAMGVKCSRWVTMHGLAFNVNTDLSLFENIVPCGIDDKQVTSLEQELGRKVDLEGVKKILLTKLELLFEMNIKEVTEFTTHED